MATVKINTQLQTARTRFLWKGGICGWVLCLSCIFGVWHLCAPPAGKLSSFKLIVIILRPFKYSIKFVCSLQQLFLFSRWVSNWLLSFLNGHVWSCHNSFLFCSCLFVNRLVNKKLGFCSTLITCLRHAAISVFEVRSMMITKQVSLKLWLPLRSCMVALTSYVFSHKSPKRPFYLHNILRENPALLAHQRPFFSEKMCINIYSQIVYVRKMLGQRCPGVGGGQCCTIHLLCFYSVKLFLKVNA